MLCFSMFGMWFCHGSRIGNNCRDDGPMWTSWQEVQIIFIIFFILMKFSGVSFCGVISYLKMCSLRISTFGFNLIFWDLEEKLKSTVMILYQLFKNWFGKKFKEEFVTVLSKGCFIMILNLRDDEIWVFWVEFWKIFLVWQWLSKCLKCFL